MKNQIILRLSTLLLLIVLLTSMLFNCVDLPTLDYSETSSSTTTIDSLGTTTKPTTTTRPTTTPTTSSSITRPSNSTSNGDGSTPAGEHADVDNNGWCDDCGIDVVETIDFYNFNDLHGKFEHSYATDAAYGVQKLTTYIENQRETDDHVVLLSSGDMWQGGSASNETKGRIVTDWMNYLGFEAMTLGNHEFDWGQDAIKTNVALAEFPILAINIYDNATGKRVDYCEPSVMIERGGAQIGIIGAIGDCYSSISSEMTTGITFKVGSALTSLVKAESEKLREAGADIIIYLIHDGTTYSDIDVTDYYDESLSSGGYIDVVFGGHTHSYYITTDRYGVPHLQGGGDNDHGITHVEVDVNFANGNITYNVKDYVVHSQCQNLTDSPVVENLKNKYWDEISKIYNDLGYNASYRNSSSISSTIAKLYYEAGVAKWGKDYDIVLAGGSLSTRYPYKVLAGQVQYADLMMAVPFDNPLYLCAVSGSTLKKQFINNSKYVKYYTISASNIKDNGTYYIIADSWTALYYYANCTVIEKYDDTTFARDLLAEYIKAGGWSK